MVASDGLVRRALAERTGVPAETWVLGKGEHGRPVVVGPDARWRFSVAHTAGMVMVGVSEAEIGVDVERLDRRIPDGVAGRWFAGEEAAALVALPEPERGRRFLELWTLKEAYAKARGLGVIGLALDSFVVALDPPRLVRSAGDDPARWHLECRSLGEHLVAIVTTDPGRAELREASL
ncbi:MAG TPA: 4'-phosphopantetheinyl transferase superfamily protein [Kofleriaceae bacterium]|nr:4'-phosphopantetheinyl transferase superfamily protein [Kofleriaceae bacterium]